MGPVRQVVRGRWCLLPAPTETPSGGLWRIRNPGAGPAHVHPRRPVTTTFRDLGVDAALCDALEAKGITHPFPIQALTLPMALTGSDLIGQARTGTGKTLAFGLPLLQRLDPTDRRTQALVIVPTRELCLQVHDDLAIGAARGLTTIAVYGGTPYEEQTEALQSGVHVVVGTPGRLLDHLNRGTLDLSAVRVLVLDEADEMLDMGFLPDVERLIESCPATRHTMLFSATMPTAIVRMARRYMVGPTFTRADSTEAETAPNVEQHFFQVHRMDKPRLLARILQSPERGSVYVFVRTKHMADRVVEELGDLGTEAIAIHGDLRQTTREKNLDRFREGKVTVLVATEVAARGLDVEGVSHVVNYDCPEDEKMYLHRIGRTARAGHAGVAVTFVEHSEVERANLIRRALDRLELEVVPMFSTSPELVGLFGVPADVPWSRAVAKRRAPGEATGRDGGGRGRGGRDSGGRDSGGRSAGKENGKDGGGRGRSDGRRDGRSDESRSPRGARGETPPAVAEGAPAREDTPDDRRVTSPSGAGTRTRTRSRGSGRGADAGTASEQRDAATVRTVRPNEDESRSDERATSDARPRRRRGGRGRGGSGASDGTHTASGRENGRRTGDDPKGASDSAVSSEREGGARSSRSRGAKGARNGAKSSSGGGDAASRSSSSGAAREKKRATASESGGRPARGDGQPELSRRVKVEHLP